MRPLLAMVKANLKMTVRNRTALFWNLAFPALFILIFGAVFGQDTGIDFTVGIAGAPSALREETIAMIEEHDAFTLEIGDEASELAALREGERDVVLVFGPALEGGGYPAVRLFYDETAGPNARIAVSAVRQLLLSAAQAENPVPITEEPVSGERISFIDFFVPGILAMALMNSGVLGLANAFVAYRERGILRRIKMTPFPLTHFVLARVISQLIVAVAQAVILVGLGVLLFEFTMRGNPAVIALGILAGALAFLAVGFAIAAVARNVETAESLGNAVTLPMLFLSGVFFSVGSMPEWLQPIARVLPLRYLVDALREPMTRGRGLEAIWLDLLVLAVTFLVGMVIAVRFFRWEARGA